MSARRIPSLRADPAVPDISTACFVWSCERCPGWVAWKDQPACQCPHHAAGETLFDEMELA
jgi:hypothetical protein